MRGHQKVTSQNPEGTQEALSKYARDLTAAAAEGKLDPVSVAPHPAGYLTVERDGRRSPVRDAAQHGKQTDNLGEILGDAFHSACS